MKKFLICGNPFPSMTHQISKIEKFENFRFLNLIYGAQRTCQPHCFLLSCVEGVKYLHLQFKYLAQQGNTHFEGSKSAKK